MKSVFTILNDYRDTIFYSACLVAAIAGTWVIGTKMLTHVTLMISVRECLRIVNWGLCSDPKRSFLLPVCNSLLHALAILIWFLPPYEPRILYSFTAGLFIGINIVLFTLSNDDMIKYFGFKRLVKIYAKLYWQELFDWPRKQKPPARRFDKAADAIKRLMQKIADVTAPAPCPEAA